MPLLANTGVPMLLVAGVPLVLAFVPIVVIEALVWRWGVKERWFKSLWVATVLNLGSTFVGVPITWVGLVIIQAVGEVAGMVQRVGPLWRFAWHGPNRDGDYDATVITTAALLLVVPFYLTSALVEGWWATLAFKGERRRSLMQVSFIANAATYVPIAVYWCVMVWLS